MTEISNQKIFEDIKQIIENSRFKVLKTINTEMINAYWNIGKIIVEEELKGEKRAKYGDYLIKGLSKKLTKEFGKGFTPTNLKYMRKFYNTFQISHAVRDQLSWTHYRILLKIEDDKIRNFYLIESIENKWSTRELERQINSLLYERIALSKNKEETMKLSIKGQDITKKSDLIKDPYVLEFLNIKDNFLEKDIETGLIEKLKEFLLELGKGFTFVSNQKRITVDNDHYYVDLVFYNYILKCFFLIELKSGKLSHKDIGQMDFYVRYFDKEIKQNEDNKTIGLILCSNKNETMVKYTALDDKNNIFASKYKMYLPTEEELKKEIEYEKHILNVEKNNKI